MTLVLAGVLLIVPLLWLYSPGFCTPEGSSRMLPGLRTPKHRTLVVYHFYEHQPHHDNLLYFLKYGMHGTSDFLFVLNGDVSEAINASLPEHLPNVRVIRRENKCFDLGSYGAVLDQLEAEGRLSRYTAIILMNASVIGPVVPTYVNECWTRLFTNRLSGSVGMVGTTFNCLSLSGHTPHLQSMLLAFSPAGLSVVRPVLQCYETKEEAIMKAEIMFLGLVLSAGLHASVLDGAVVSPITHNRTCLWYNVYSPQGYHGVDLNPYDVVFFKNTPDTGIPAAQLELYKGFMDRRNYSSWDRC